MNGAETVSCTENRRTSIEVSPLANESSRIDIGYRLLDVLVVG
jgi:hypothetical protein